MIKIEVTENSFRYVVKITYTDNDGKSCKSY